MICLAIAAVWGLVAIGNMHPVAAVIITIGLILAHQLEVELADADDEEGRDR